MTALSWILMWCEDASSHSQLVNTKPCLQYLNIHHPSSSSSSSSIPNHSSMIFSRPYSAINQAMSRTHFYPSFRLLFKYRSSFFNHHALCFLLLVLFDAEMCPCSILRWAWGLMLNTHLSPFLRYLSSTYIVLIYSLVNVKNSILCGYLDLNLELCFRASTFIAQERVVLFNHGSSFSYSLYSRIIAHNQHFHLSYHSTSISLVCKGTARLK